MIKRSVLAVLVCLVAANALAVTSEYRILLDLDNNAATGCSGGYEQVLVTTVDTTGPGTATVTRVERQVCSGGTFGPLIFVDGGWPVGVGLGLDGFHVIETYFPLSGFSGQQIRVNVVTASDSLTSPAFITIPQIAAIPTLGEWALIFSALLLITAAMFRMKQRQTIAVLFLISSLAFTGVALAAIVLDGSPSDWTPADKLADDPIGDGAPGQDIRALFAQVDLEAGRIYFRIDGSLIFNQSPTANAGTAGTSMNTPVTVTLTGSDPEGDPLTFEVVTGPASGSLGAITPVNATTAQIQYTPNSTFVGDDSFTFRVNDGSSNSAPATISITVSNTIPVANSQSTSTSTNTPVTITLTGTDPNGDPLTFSIVDSPTNGTLGAITPLTPTSAQVQYTPNSNFEGSDSFTFRVSDGTNNSSPATVSISVVNGLPTANPQTVTTGADTGVTITLTGSDPESSPLTFSIVTNPTNGSLGAITPINATSASVLYTPNSGFTGNDSFTFRVNDGTADSSPATVTINVEAAPVANDDAPAGSSAPGDPFHAAFNTPLVSTTSVLANDTGFPTPTVTAFDAASTQGGTVSVNANGTFTYTPPAGFVGFDTFNYTATNAQGSDTATVTIAVGVRPAGVNDSYGTDSATNLTVPAPGVLGNDAGTSLGVSAVNGSAANVGNPIAVTGGTVTVNADGSLTFNPSGSPGTASFTYTASNNLGTSTATVTVAIDEVPTANDDGPAGNSVPGDPYHTAVNTSLNSGAGTPYSVLANDTGGPAPTVASFGPTTGAETTAGSGGTTAQGGTLTVNANGQFVYTPPSGFVGFDTFVYTASNTAGSDTATVTIAVGVRPAGVNDSYNVGTSNVLNISAPGVLGNDTGSPTLTVTQVNGSGANVGVPIAVGGGTLTLNADGSFTYSAGAAPEAPAFTYTVANALGSGSATVTLNVLQGPTAVDDAPSPISVTGDNYHTDVDVAINSGTGTPYSVLANDLGSSVSVISFGPATGAETAAGGSGATAQGGMVSVQATGIFTYTPPSGFVGFDTFLYTIQNTIGSDVGQVSIAVGDRVDGLDDSYNVAASGTLNTPAPGVLGNDTGDGTRTVTALNGIPAAIGVPTPIGGGTLTLNADGSFTYVAPAAPGPVIFTYTVTSPLGADNPTVTINVLTPPTAVNDGPAANSSPGDNYHAALNGSINSNGVPYRLTDNDTGSPTLTVDSFGPTTGAETPANNPGVTAQGGTLTVNSNGTFTYNAPAGFVGLDTFRYVISNSVGTSTGTVTIAVGARPSATNDAYGSIGNVGLTISAANGVIQKATADSGDSLNVTHYGTVGNPATTPGNNFTTTNGGTLNMAADGSFTYMPAAGFEGSDTFDYRIANALGSDDATVTITVNEVIWFVQAGASAGGDGRINSPFNCLVGTGCFDPTAADEAGDHIFLYAGTYNDTGVLTLLGSQRLIGQGATESLAALTSITEPTGSNTLPATNGANPVINSTAGGVVLGSGNHVYGLTIGNSVGIDLSGNGFGTLTLEEVTLNGTGRPLSLVTGTINGRSATAATFEGIISTSSSGGQGVLLQAVGGSMESTGGTTITSPATQPILISGSSVVTSFGNTSVTGGTDGVSLQNNSGSTTFGTLSIQTPGAVGFLHSVGGGAVTAGATTITNPVGIGIDVDSLNANLTFGTTTVNKNATAGTAVDLTSNTLRTITFDSLTVNASNGTGINATGGGTLIVTNNTGTITATNGAAMNANGVIMDVEFTSTSSTNSGTNAISLNTVSGTGVNFGNTTANSSAATGVLLQSNSAPITFADLDIAPDSGVRALHATNNTGTITAASGTINAPNATAVEIAGASSATRTPLAIVLTSVSSAGGSTPGIVVQNTNGSFTVAGTGSASSGGTISGKAGGTNGTDGVSAVDAVNVSLNWMNISSNTRNGVFAQRVNGIQINNSTLTNNSDQATPDEAGIQFVDVTGTLSAGSNPTRINSTVVETSFEHNVLISNTSTTLTDLQINGSTFRNSDVPNGGDGILLVGAGTAAMTANVVNATFSGNVGDGLQSSCTGTGTVTANISASTISGNSTGLSFSPSNTCTTVFNVANNTGGGDGILSSTVTAIAIDPIDSSIARGTISNNTINGVTNGIGVFGRQSGASTLTADVSSNTISGTRFGGIELIQLDTSTGSLNINVLNNNVSAPTEVSGAYGILVHSRGTASACTDIFNNTSTGSAGLQGINFRQRETSTMRLERLAANTNVPGTVVTHLQGTNTATAAVTLTGTVQAVANGFCPTP
jgi:hypothetical protein